MRQLQLKHSSQFASDIVREWSKMKICTIAEAIRAQKAIDEFLFYEIGSDDLVGRFGKVLAASALRGELMPPITKGFDVRHPEYRRVQVKTRKLPRDGRRETRAVGFREPNEFDWLCHVVLNNDYSVWGAWLVPYEKAWPMITQMSMKISAEQSRSLGLDFTEVFREAFAGLLSAGESAHVRAQQNGR